MVRARITELGPTHLLEQGCKGPDQAPVGLHPIPELPVEAPSDELLQLVDPLLEFVVQRPLLQGQPRAL